MPEFIFMLTNQDKTIPDALEKLKTVLAAGARHIGFKDVGLPFQELVELAAAIKASGSRFYLEVVSLDAESEKRSAEAAIRLGVDVLMGGTRPEVVLPLIENTKIKYYPFPGKIVGHPSVLTGTIEEIAESAKRIAGMRGVHGLDLLAYRFKGDVPALIRAVVSAATPKPVVVAGSIDRRERLEAVVRGNAAGFTVGTAALDGVFEGEKDLQSQLNTINAMLRDITASSEGTPDKVNLAKAFATFNDKWSPKISGDVNNFQVKLAKFEGPFHWHHHDHEDELFLVVKGKLRMGFRDRNVDLDESEFIIVPHGVEHKPEALTDECHILLLEPNSTHNTGNVENERTVKDLGRI